MVKPLYDAVRDELHRYKTQAFNTPEFLIVDEDTYFKVMNSVEERERFIPACAQSEVAYGDTYLGLKVAVLSNVRTPTVKVS